jgi:hypothetical protein
MGCDAREPTLSKLFVLLLDFSFPAPGGELDGLTLHRFLVRYGGDSFFDDDDLISVHALQLFS